MGDYCACSVFRDVVLESRHDVVEITDSSYVRVHLDLDERVFSYRIRWRSTRGLEEFWAPAKYLQGHEKVLEVEKKQAKETEEKMKRKAARPEETEGDSKRVKSAQE